MSVTLDEIVTHQDRLRREIMERECLLAAFNVLHGYVASGRVPHSAELGALTARLIAPVREAPSIPAALPEPSPVTPPPPARPVQKMNPELKQIGYGHGAHTDVVRWAIARMTTDYSLLDLAALLKREGYNFPTPRISVVLTRLKGRGEIHEIQRGMGPKPAIFRKPENPIPLLQEATDPVGDDPGSNQSEATA